MTALFDPQFRYLWMIALAALLFLPVRKLIWVLQVRRALRHGGDDKVDDSEQARLKRRAGVTSALLCLVFSFFYVSYLFGR